MPNRIGGFCCFGSSGKPHVRQRCITGMSSAKWAEPESNLKADTVLTIHFSHGLAHSSLAAAAAVVFDQRSVLLRGLIHVRDGLCADLIHPLALL